MLQLHCAGQFGSTWSTAQAKYFDNFQAFKDTKEKLLAHEPMGKDLVRICPQNVDYSDYKAAFLKTIEAVRDVTVHDVRVSLQVKKCS